MIIIILLVLLLNNSIILCSDANFFIEMKYVHFKIKTECKVNKNCDHINRMINETIHLLNTENIYNIKFSYILTNNSDYNLHISLVNKESLNNVVAVCYYNIFDYNFVKILIYDLNDYEENLISLRHEIISHALKIGHQNGQEYTELTSAIITKKKSKCGKYFVFNNINKIFLKYNLLNKEIVNYSYDSCKIIINTLTNKIYECKNKNRIYYIFSILDFSILNSHKIQYYKNVNKNMYDKVINNKSVFIFKNINSALNNVLIYGFEIKNIKSFKYKGYINSGCTSIAKIEFSVMNGEYYINLGNYNSILYDDNNKIITCCINGIICNNVINRKNETIINYYRNMII